MTVRTPTGFVSRRTGGWRRADRSSDKSHSRSVSAVVNRELSTRFHRKFSVQHFDETRAVEPLETHRDPERRSRRDNPDRSGDHVNNISNRPTRVALEETEEGAHKGLRIESEDGQTTLLRFRSPALPETVDGVIVR